MFPIYLFLAFFVANSLNAQNNSIKEPKFEKVDACAKDKIYFKEKDIEKLAKALNRCATRGISKEISKSNSFKEVLAINKARAITVWMAENMAYDYDKNCNYDVSDYDKKNHDVENILKNREIVCEGYATLFKALADKMKLTAVYISGFVSKDPEARHAWNAFKTPKGWHIVDVTWFDNTEAPVCGKMSLKEQMEKKSKLVKSISDFTNNGKEVYSSREFYFMPDPVVFIQDHFPNNPEYQLINPPIKKEDYLSSK